MKSKPQEVNDILTFRQLSVESILEITFLGQQLNPKISSNLVREYFNEMFQFQNFYCFGMFVETSLIGISSSWITARLYSGRQLEVDNLIVDNIYRSKGIGKKFLEFIEQWAKKKGCQTIELNTYVQNSKSHKFYFNEGYSILGFHFSKPV